MKYRISASVILDFEIDANTLFNNLANYQTLMRTIRTGQETEEHSYIMIELHYHDEDPTKPCQLIQKIESV